MRPALPTHLPPPSPPTITRVPFGVSASLRSENAGAPAVSTMTSQCRPVRAKYHRFPLEVAPSGLCRRRPDGHPLAGAAEDAQDLGGLFSRAAEPVRYLGVELDDLAGPEDPVLVADDESQSAGQDVDPLRAVVNPRLGADLAGRNDDLPGLHPVGLPGEGNDGSTLDVAVLE